DRLDHAVAQGEPGGVAEPQLLRRGGRRDERAAGVGHIAAELGGDVDVHEVARRDETVAGHAVRHLLVDADAGGAREVVGHLRRRARAVPLQEARADLVELAGRHPRPDPPAHLLQGQADDAADALQALEILLRLDRHPGGLSLSAIGCGVSMIAPPLYYAHASRDPW